MKITNQLKHFLSDLGMHHCVICRTTISPEALLCHFCQTNMMYPVHFCRHCGVNMPDKVVMCQACHLTNDRRITDIHAPFVYDGSIRWLIRELKFKRSTMFARTLASLAQPAWQDCLIKYPHACIIPMPVDRWRLAVRGFNQTLEILRQLPVTNHMVRTNLLFKRVGFGKQSQRKRTERLSFLKTAFYCRPVESLPFIPETVILLDDVFTTGATAQAAAAALSHIGVKKVIIFAIAKTM